jgi:hypothetical protein
MLELDSPRKVYSRTPTGRRSKLKSLSRRKTDRKFISKSEFKVHKKVRKHQIRRRKIKNYRYAQFEEHDDPGTDPFHGVKTTQPSAQLTRKNFNFKTSRRFKVGEIEDRAHTRAMNFSDIIEKHENGESMALEDPTTMSVHDYSKRELPGESKRKSKIDSNEEIEINLAGSDNDDDQYKFRPKTLYEEMSKRVDRIVNSRKNLSIASLSKIGLKAKFNDSEIELSANRDLSNTRAQFREDSILPDIAIDLRKDKT